MLCLVRPAHGYALMAEIERLTEGELCIGPGTMYTTLKKLLAAGLVQRVEAGGKTYLITPEGQTELHREYARRQRMLARSENILYGLGGTDEKREYQNHLEPRLGNS